MFEFVGETDPRWYNYKNEFKTPILQSIGELSQLFSGSGDVFLDITSSIVDMVKNFPKIKIYSFPSSINVRIPAFQFKKIMLYVDRIMVEFILGKLKDFEYNFQIMDIRYYSELLNLIKSKNIIRTLEEAWKCYENGLFEAGSPMLRKALETSLHIALKIGKGDDDALYNSSHVPYSLPKKIDIIMGIGLLSNFLAQDLKSKTKFFGDLGAHDSLVTIRREDFESANISLQKALEHLFRKVKGNN
ncbi:hypothetical protein CEE45_08550 [Candidatus Heimdallarchaeota archaeon B3_Heim]|nr:MAG: hypothetical protein CEE45_08550 [Candidatus Heimdallarchaeota archaeon B3_Heim]